MSNRAKWIRIAGFIVAAVAMIFLAGRLDSYYMTVITTLLIYLLEVLGIRLLLGMGGQMSFAAVTFMGVGAFAAAQLSKNAGLPSALALLAAVAMGVLFAFLFGLLLLRMKDSFFIFGTISLLYIMATIFQNFKPISGGADGIYGIPQLSLFGMAVEESVEWFVLLGVIAVLCALLVERINKTSLGRSLMAIRDDELAAAVMGVNVYRTKVIAFTIAGGMAALGGALLAFRNGVVSASLFTFDVQLKFLTMAMLGGIQSTLGAVLGTMIVQLMPELLRPLLSYMNLVYGTGIVLLMIYMPMGIVGLAQSIIKKQEKKKRAKLRGESKV